MKIHFTLLSSNLLLFSFGTCAYAMQPKLSYVQHLVYVLTMLLRESNSILALTRVMASFPYLRNNAFKVTSRISCCNVPILGHHYIAEVYDDQSSQMDVIASTRIIKGNFGVWLASLIPFHHYDPFCTCWIWFRFISMISMILSILSYKLIKFTEKVILGTLLGGTSKCNSSLESGGETLQDGMVICDFQWLGKPQGEIRHFSDVKRLIH
jgi:hypothetical protein